MEKAQRSCWGQRQTQEKREAGGGHVLPWAWGLSLGKEGREEGRTEIGVGD